MSFLADDRILVLGHRGESFRATENTIKSYECALKDGADGVELDVHITKDGKLAVIHDFSTKRVFGVERNVEELTMAELKGISPEIPELGEVFDALGDVFYDIEIKANIRYDRRVVEILSRTLSDRSGLNHILVSSFNPLAMRAFSKESRGRYPMAIIYDGPPTTVPRALQHGQGRLFFHCSFLKPKADIAREEARRHPGWSLIPWNADTEKDLETALACGAKALITNRTDIIVRALKEAGLR